MFVTLILLLADVGQAIAGAVGECRSECIERNTYAIVRVHLKVRSTISGTFKELFLSNIKNVMLFR
ncbi:unnamed protein product [Nippostrongylus brasiliensis]|uniref:Secreted protein n=1 Tax=Nippostrongylus brasiliensis TaxID=27835 RepID=A0A0N4Y306_NIPBR|nr:unnamed protein product [Nippostrongylus brasiliensis]